MNESMEPLQNRSPREERLDALFRAYHTACEPRPAGPNFMPELWQKIERAQSATFSFRRISQRFVTAAAALSLVLAAIGFYPQQQDSPLYNESYVEALAAHNEGLPGSGGNDIAEDVELLRLDSAEDSDEL